MEAANRRWTWAAFALLGCTALIPLLAPVFPTQDGPVHLYYVDVLRDVLKHSAPYAQHFEIKRLLTPYALEYYGLLALETLFSAWMSERLLLVGYIVVFCLGFRYLVESVAERGSPWILAGIPFCLHMMVYMGFLNFSVAVALLLFQCGYWIRHSGNLTKGQVTALLIGLMLMLLTHPVPVAVFLLFAGVYLACDVGSAGSTWKERLSRRWRPFLLLAAMGVMALAWVSLFVDSVQRGDSAPNYLSSWGWFNVLATELQLFPVSAFTRVRDRAGPILLAGVACIILLEGLWSNRRTLRQAPIALAVTSGICFVLFGIVPARVNGSYYFAERFPIIMVLFLLAGAAAMPLARAWTGRVGYLAAAVSAGVLILQWGNVSEISFQIALAEDAAPAAAGSVGLLIGPRRSTPDGLAFNPYMWSGAHYFLRSRAILANEPWMDLPIIMLRPTHPDDWSYLDPDDARERLVDRIAGGGTFKGLDFVVQTGPADVDIHNLMARSGWSHTGDADDAIRVYRPPGR